MFATEASKINIVDKEQRVTIEESVIQKLRGLPPERQREVLDFVEFLETKAPQASSPKMSALELAGSLLGSVEGGPGNLATDREHLKDYGT